MFPCCRERAAKGPRVNQRGDPIDRGIDDPPSGHEDEEAGWFGGAESEPDSSSASDCETQKEVVTFERKRAKGVSAEVYGPSNPRKAVYEAPVIEKTPQQVNVLHQAFAKAALFQTLTQEDLHPIVDAISIQTYQANDLICHQGDDGEALFVVLSGYVDLYKETVTGEGFPPPVADSTKDTAEFLRTLKESGTIFGELALLWNMPRSLTVKSNPEQPCTLGRLDREVFQHLVIQCEIKKREDRQQQLRNVKLLEMMTAEQIAKLADALKLKRYDKDENLITQGEPGKEFFILLTGECVAMVATYFLGIAVDEQEHRRYHAGELFGERAILRAEPRGASITAAVDDVQALIMSRAKFERLLGPMDQLQENQYLTDPRKIIADFYMAGDMQGPKGSMDIEKQENNRKSLNESDKSLWFAVYRPTSRDAIAKMLSGHAVGKGLNVKGKSAKKGVLSGFVPFLQISENKHKSEIEESPSDSRVILYFRNSHSRDTALAALYAILFEAGQKLQVDDKKIKTVDNYKPDVYGLDLPEPLLREAYIMVPDIVPRIGWETGRASEPAFMDMNLHAIRGVSEPAVVLYQFDEGDPMNPRGVLIAYAEQCVKPVVSDFDTFTVGSRNVVYEPLPANQAELAKWSLDNAKAVIKEPTEQGWTSRWLSILKQEAEKGVHPDFPKYGFGDPTSYRLIGDVVTATLSCGAVRHGAECFNFYFPQELDPEYLVVWEGFDDKPWDYKDEKGLRKFLLERIEEGFIFPLNPVWPIRDKGWYEVLDAMKKNPVTAPSLAAWDPPGASLLDAIEEIHAECPEGFIVQGAEPSEAAVARNPRSTADMFGADMVGCEKFDLATLELKKHAAKLNRAVTKVMGMNKIRAMTAEAKEMRSHTEDETAEGAPVFSGATAPQADKGFM